MLRTAHTREDCFVTLLFAAAAQPWPPVCAELGTAGFLCPHWWVYPLSLPSGESNKGSVCIEKLLLSLWQPKICVSKCTHPGHAAGGSALQPLLRWKSQGPHRDQVPSSPGPGSLQAVVGPLLQWHFKSCFRNRGCVFCNGEPLTCFTSVFTTVLSGSAIFHFRPQRGNTQLDGYVVI